MTENKAVVLLSGGLDSATALAIALDSGRDCYPLGFNYGQPAIELRHAARVASYYASKKAAIYTLKVIDLTTMHFDSAITNDDITLPGGRTEEEIAKGGCPATFVPGRNIIFLSIAAALAHSVEAQEVWIGVTSDVGGYPDATHEFVSQMDRTLRVGMDPNMSILAPLIGLDKADVVRRATELKVPVEYTWSCYGKGPRQCQACDACVIRANGFAAWSLKDPSFHTLVK